MNKTTKRLKILLILIFLFSLGISSTLHASDSLVANIQENLEFLPVSIPDNNGLEYARNAYYLNMDNKNNLWIGSHAGLYFYNGLNSINYTNFINKDSSIIKRDFVTEININPNGDIWFGTTEGLYRINVDSYNCSKIQYPKGLTEFYVRSIHSQGDEVFVGTHNGLYIYNQTLNEYTEEYLTNGLPHPSAGTTTIIRCIFPNNSKNLIWLTTRLGLFKINRKTKEQELYKLPKRVDGENHFFIEGYSENDKLIIATYKNGITEFDINSKEFIQVNSGFEKKGEQFNRFKTIIPLKNGLKMVNAEYVGIGIYQSTSNKITWLKFNDIIQRGDYNVQIGNDGHVYFFTSGILYRSNIQLVKSDPDFERKIVVGKIKVNGNPINFNYLEHNQVLNFNENQKNLFFQIGIQYNRPNDNLDYQYALDDNNWIKFNQNIELYNLLGGHHKLKLRVDSESENLSMVKTINFNIHVPLYKKWYFISLSFLITASLVFLIWKFITNIEKEKRTLRSHYEKKLVELESKALRSQINPHFIFNTLNSIKYYSIAKTPEETSDFISEFSLLIRQILENSKENLIAIEDEIETIERYVKIENLRFKKQFDYSFDIDPEIKLMKFLVPPMIIQPFVENAIWHGLMHKNDNRHLDLYFCKTNFGIKCIIRDNGIGREIAATKRQKNKVKSSLGLQITKERIELLNETLDMNNRFIIIDLKDNSGEALGTEVQIFFESKSQ